MSSHSTNGQRSARANPLLATAPGHTPRYGDECSFALSWADGPDGQQVRDLFETKTFIHMEARRLERRLCGLRHHYEHTLSHAVYQTAVIIIMFTSITDIINRNVLHLPLIFPLSATFVLILATFYRTYRQRHGWYTQWASTCVYVSVLWMVWLYDVQACEICMTRQLDCWTWTMHNGAFCVEPTLQHIIWTAACFQIFLLFVVFLRNILHPAVIRYVKQSYLIRFFWGLEFEVSFTDQSCTRVEIR